LIRHPTTDALTAKAAALSLTAASALEADTAKKEKKAAAKEDAEVKRKMASRVTIKRVERNKKKYVTAVMGLEAFGGSILQIRPLSISQLMGIFFKGIDLKKASKQFATKFATGASVSKNASGAEEIVVQGDVTDEIVEMLEGNVGVLKGVPADNVVCIEDKKKKGEGSGA